MDLSFDCKDGIVVPDMPIHKNQCVCFLSYEEKSYDLDIVARGFLIPGLTLCRKVASPVTNIVHVTAKQIFNTTAPSVIYVLTARRRLLAIISNGLTSDSETTAEATVVLLRKHTQRLFHKMSVTDRT
jgi:hypothetical protein